MAGFHTLQLQDLYEQLKPVNTGRVSQWQNFQRGFDTRSGNLIVTDTDGKRRIIIGVLPNNIYGMAISISGVDVIDALKE